MAIALMLLVGCDDRPAAPTASTSPATRPAAPAMQFRVDSSLLGEAKTIEGFGVSVRPPAGWAEMPAAQLAAVAAGASTRPAGDTVVPLAIFTRSQGPCVLIVSSIPAPSAEDLKANVERFRQEFGEVKVGAFQVNGLAITQYLVQPQGKVNFKLLLTDKAATKQPDRRLQLDYIVPQSAWSSQVRAVESSIGSLRAVDVP